jgi:hypothetical protein
MRKIVVLLVAAWMLATASASACSLCGAMVRRTSLTFEFEQAEAVLYGHLANPQLTGKSGAGTTEFQIDSVLKDDPAFPRKKMVLLTRYLPILDDKKPPKYVMFFGPAKQSQQPYWGREIANPAVLEFVAELHRYRDNPGERLLRAAQRFDHADPLVADEAFMIFAKADDKLIAQIAHKLDPKGLRKLVKDPDLDPERISMFAYLLGACGTDKDAELLRSLLKSPAAREYKAFEGILAGYIAMRPKEGWAFAIDTLKNDKQSFMPRYGTMRTMRFYYNAKQADAKEVMHGLSVALDHADIADIAMEDLRKWQRWDHTAQVLACWDKKSHHSEITRQSIVRYALACPLPEARAFLEKARRQAPDLVREIESAK